MSKQPTSKKKSKKSKAEERAEIELNRSGPIIESKDISLTPSEPPPIDPPVRRNKGWVHLDTETNREIYLRVLSLSGQYMTAADAVGCDRRTGLRLRETDPEFAEQCEVALERYRATLVEEARRRAVDGIDKAVIGGQFKDEIILYEKQYSDRLLELMLKRHIPEFRDSSKVETSGNVTVHHGIDLSKLTREERDMVRKLLGSGD